MLNLKVSNETRIEASKNDQKKVNDQKSIKHINKLSKFK